MIYIQHRSLSLLLFLAIGSLLPLTNASKSDLNDPKRIFSSAVAVWHMADASDSAGEDSTLTPRGDVRLGAALKGADREASLKRGGDGKVAELRGGWLDAGQGRQGELNITGEQFTALIRMRAPTQTAWDTRGYFTKGGSHDRLVFNFFTFDFGAGPENMRLGCEIGVEGKPGLAAQVTVPLVHIGPTAWHDVLARYDGRELVLFIDGVPVDRQPVTGRLRQNKNESLAIGAGGPGDDPFPGLIDHAALWNRALSDEEIVVLCGGKDEVERHRTQFAAAASTSRLPSTQDLVESYRTLINKFQKDPHRPRYHFLHCEAGDAMPGDANGAIYWKDRYHLFYIFQRQEPVSKQIVHCWGHASSVDLLHWEHHPTALDVAPDDPDRGIFSGNAFVTKEGIPAILYHGVDAGNCIALAQDDLLIRWKKLADNPIVPMPKPGTAEYGKYDSWDPHGWLEGDTYYAIFGENPGTGTKAALFKGPSLTQLKFVGPFMAYDRWSEPGEDISCPDFFPIGNKHMLLCISHMRGARYFVGQWDRNKGVFTPEFHGRMNWPGGAFFAPETLLDAKGRRILFAWCLDERPRAARIASGWSGVMSLPRVLSLSDDGTLRIEPVEELKQLRSVALCNRVNISLPADQEWVLNDVQGDSLEIEVELQPEENAECGVVVRRTPDGEEQTVISFRPDKGVLKIDVSKSTLDPAIRYRSWCLWRPQDPADAERRVLVQEAPLALEQGEPLRLRIFLDRSMLEVFANERQCLTQRLWPTRSDALGVSLFSRGRPTRVTTLNAWRMAATTPH
jgi:sucrose-6-phosphate hydrolase SacC (GH32 family)